MAIRSCNCNNDYQDKVHGKNMRVFTEGKKPNQMNLKCTICGSKKVESSKGEK